MSGAFDDNGTPTDFTDDKPHGHAAALPGAAELLDACRSRPDAMVTDCVDGTDDGRSGRPRRPRLARQRRALARRACEYRGSIYHQGRGAGGAATPAFDSTEDIDFNHEAELSDSGRLPDRDRRARRRHHAAGRHLHPGRRQPGRQRRRALLPERRRSRATPAGRRPRRPSRPTPAPPRATKAIYRAPIRTQPRGTVCTAHVFQQIPGQNRIFMGWYSQGTQVIDFVENADGTVALRGGRLLHPRERQRVGLAHLQDRSRTPTAPSPTGARPATSTSARRAATRSTSTRSRCRRHRSPRRRRCPPTRHRLRLPTRMRRHHLTRTRRRPGPAGRPTSVIPAPAGSSSGDRTAPSRLSAASAATRSSAPGAATGSAPGPGTTVSSGSGAGTCCGAATAPTTCAADRLATGSSVAVGSTRSPTVTRGAIGSRPVRGMT